jgi:hypothetical protein
LAVANLSNFFIGLTKNYHYSDKILSTKRKSFFIGVKKYFQACEKSFKKGKRMNLNKGKQEFAGLQTSVSLCPN